MRHWITLLLLACCLAGTAHAGRSCDARQPTAATLERGLTLAEKTWSSLEAGHAAHGTKVVVLARAGQDLSRYGIRYSHVGLAWRTPEGAWRVLHKLNQCGTAHASIYRQGLGEFFLDDLWRYEAAWVVPTPAVQARLHAWLQDPQRAASMHHRPYSLVSYAWGRRYQQSNQWAIETLAAAMEPAVRDRDAAQAWLMLQRYEPATLRLGPLTRLGGRLSGANVAFDDHPPERRFADRIDTVTADSVLDWLQRARLSGAPVTLNLPTSQGVSP